MTTMEEERQQTLNAWISQMQEVMGRPITLVKGEGEPVPYLTWNSESTDGYLHFQIDDHKIKAGHVWVEQGGIDEPIAVPSATHENEQVFIGYKSDEGITLMFKPETIVYLEESEDDRPDPLKLILDTFCKEFFEGWREGQLQYRLSSIFRRMRTRSADGIRRELERQRRRVRDAYRNVDENLRLFAETNRRVIAVENMDVDGFREECQGWEEACLQQGALSVDGEILRLRVPVFTINDGSNWDEGNGRDVPLGPLNIRFNLQSYVIKVDSEDNLSHQESYPHPHVSREGDICWGRGENANLIQNLLARPNPMEILFTVAHFLKTGYHEPGAYVKLPHWQPPEGWMCHHCNARHPDGQACPQHCGRCDAHVNWDSHAHCETHSNCYESPMMCPGCLAELPSFGSYVAGEELPNVIQPPKYTFTPDGGEAQERTASYDYVSFGRAPLLEVDYIKEEAWYWIQSSDENDELLRRHDWIYKRQQNGTFQLHWTNPEPAVIEPEPEVEEAPAEPNESSSNELNIDSDVRALFDHYHLPEMDAQALCDALHTDEIPSYDDVPEDYRPTLRAFRRRSRAQRLRLAERFVSFQQAA